MTVRGLFILQNHIQLSPNNTTRFTNIDPNKDLQETSDQVQGSNHITILPCDQHLAVQLN